MFNVFSRAQALSIGVSPNRHTAAVGCCLGRLEPGVFEVRAACARTEHAWATTFVDRPDLVEKRMDMSAGEIAHDTELALATTSGRLLVARSFRAHRI